MIYLDASALIKLIKPESETAVLRTWRAELERPTELVTSALARTEISRTLYRAGNGSAAVRHAVAEALKDVHTVDVDASVLARAAAFSIPRLGTLDAIHLATAEQLRRELAQFITYDDELAAAATDVGLTVASPRSP